jgi:hypothetical protein
MMFRSAMGFSMGYGPAKDEDSKKTLAKAVELGCVFWDSAVVYGAGHNEKLLGDFIREAGCRDKVFVASKCGIEVRLQAFHSHLKDFRLMFPCFYPCCIRSTSKPSRWARRTTLLPISTTSSKGPSKGSDLPRTFITFIGSSREGI